MAEVFNAQKIEAKRKAIRFMYSNSAILIQEPGLVLKNFQLEDGDIDGYDEVEELRKRSISRERKFSELSTDSSALNPIKEVDAQLEYTPVIVEQINRRDVFGNYRPFDM